MSLPKILVVEFAPRESESRTKMLRTYFTDLVSDHTKLTVLDVAKNAPPLHTGESIRAYYARNYQKKDVSSAETKILKPFDSLRDQMLDHDIIMISTPMYNFGMPAPVKAWIDAVMQREYVYTTDENGHKPLLQEKKVILLYTSGIVFDQVQENEKWNGLVAEGAKLFEYMGADIVRVVSAQGLDMLAPHFVEFRLENVAKRKLNTIAKNWFEIERDDLVTY